MAFPSRMLDYSQIAVDMVNGKAQASGLGELVTAIRHDVRAALPFADNRFDAAYSHMLYCMPITNAEVERLSQEIHRVLKPGGLNIFTVRHTGDPHFGTGIHRGEEMYEVGGFIVNFFDRAKVERVSQGYDLLNVGEFEEAGMPRKLFRVTLKKPTVRPEERQNINDIRHDRCYSTATVKPGVEVPQNSSRIWSAIIRGELSPPRPTPNSPVGGEVV
jgi:SAM-dependent methyltransferase